MRAGIATPVLVLVLACGAGVAWADSRLDQMMQNMKPKAVDQPPARAADPQASFTVDQDSPYADVGTAPASLEDAVGEAMDGMKAAAESVGRLWDQLGASVAEAREAVRQFPLPHFYWAPGIVEDTMTAMWNRIDKEFFPDSQEKRQ